MGVLLADGSEPGPATTLPDSKPLYEVDVDLSGPIADYDARLAVIRDAAAQLPAELTGLLTAFVRRSTAWPPKSR